MLTANESPAFFIPLTDLDPRNTIGDFDLGGGFVSSDQFVGDKANSALKYLCDPERISLTDWPLVLFGPNGTGKTVIGLSLASSIAAKSNKKLCVFSASGFRRRFASSVDTNSTAQFRDNIVKSAVLFIDDLHDLTGHESTQIEFTSLLDRLLELKIPVVCTVNERSLMSDNLTHRLASRLTQGLCLSVNAPGRIARQILLSEIAQTLGLEISDNAMDFLISKLTVTYPKIRFFVVQLKTWLHAVDRDCNTLIDQPDIAEFLASRQSSNWRTTDAIIREVGKIFKLKPAEIKSNSRKQSTVLARGIAIYLLRNLLNMSYARIGSAFGGRDHSTIMHALSRIELKIKNDENDLKNTVLNIEQSILEKYFLDTDVLCG